MTNCIASKNTATRRFRLIAFAAALAVVFAVSLPQAAQAEDDVTPPPVPPEIRVDAGNEAFLIGHAVGTQNYICLPADSGFAWTLFTPQATLFNDEGKQLITHFFSVNPNPDDHGAIRATWESSRDTSTIWAQVVPPAIVVSEDSVAWVKLQVVGEMDGPNGPGRLTHTTFVQRVNTVGGVAPKSGCASLPDVGKKAFQHYTADYVFFRRSDRDF